MASETEHLIGVGAKEVGFRERSLRVEVLAVEEEGKVKPKSCLESGREEERVLVLGLGFGIEKEEEEELWKVVVAISMALSHWQWLRGREKGFGK